MVWKLVLAGCPGVVTVTYLGLPESGGDKEKFWQIFNERMNIAEDALAIGWNAPKKRHQLMRRFSPVD